MTYLPMSKCDRCGTTWATREPYLNEGSYCFAVHGHRYKDLCAECANAIADFLTADAKQRYVICPERDAAIVLIAVGHRFLDHFRLELDGTPQKEVLIYSREKRDALILEAVKALTNLAALKPPQTDPISPEPEDGEERWHFGVGST